MSLSTTETYFLEEQCQVNLLKYPKENATVGGANTWAYGDGSKPEIEPKFTTYQADAEWIAGLIKGVPISMIEDLAWMTSFLQNKGRAELLKKIPLSKVCFLTLLTLRTTMVLRLSASKS